MFRSLAIASYFAISLSYGAVWVVPEKGDVVGEVQITTSQPGETLSDVGIRFDIGYYEMLGANPQLDANRQLLAQTKVIIPSQYVLPPGSRQGIVINLAEFRLYFYPPNDNVVITMPVGIGREGWSTPIGLTKVTSKERDPIWRPTDNVRAEAAKHGTPIPNEFPSGEGNPLGRHVLRLGWATYLIHGTNRRDGVGSRVSAGCIRMMPEDIENLFGMVPVGTPVRVINEPVKLGQFEGSYYLEAHPLLEEHHESLTSKMNKQLANLTRSSNLNRKIITQELTSPSGIPKKILS